VIMLAGLQTIPRDLNEAAQVDGATPTQAFWYITVPLMRPVLLFTSITSTIGTFGGLFAEVMALTRGGPTNATLTPIIRMYKVAFEGFQFGYASALGYTFFALIFVVTLLQLRVFERER
jgi:lactose/L-arabinose transport system permease protein